MYGNKIVQMHIPQGLGENVLTELETLNMSYNDLASIPDDLDRLTSLRVLRVANNVVERVPVRVCEMQSLRTLDVSSNPLLQPPVETCARGIHAMRRYYACLKAESKERS